MSYTRFLALGFVAFLMLQGVSANAKENVGEEERTRKREKQQLAAGCEPPTAAVFLDVNNVRARIMNGGDMWWDLTSNARYIVPNRSEPPFNTSLFAGSLWIGGFDQGGNLREAAMTYRQQQSYDYWPGPLDTTDASVSSEVCNNYDKIWKVNRDDIEAIEEGETDNIPDDIQNWPTRGDLSKGQSRYIAPFKDNDNDGVYNPERGDVPDIPGDQALFYVYNDKGNIHSETQAPAIGMEIQTTAFAFSTNDQVNNQTFYRHKLVNRSSNRLDSMFFGQWVDPDLGFAFDDYVACDTSRDLGICYNGDNFDEGSQGYGQNPPSVGVDFFEGPRTQDGKTLGMRYFVYYNNDFSPSGNPSEAQHYYNYLTGTWKDGQPITEGANGRNQSNPETRYMFPGDPAEQEGWTEGTAGNEPGDRRFIQSSGPFTLMPGAVNTVTVGVVWAKATSGGNIGSLDLLRLADDRAQQLYNNDFDILNGPPSPTVKTQELNRKIIVSLKETRETENYFDRALAEKRTDTIEYQFEGYKLLQLENADVSPSQFDNDELARQVRQVDVQNQISTLVNQEFKPQVNEFQSSLEVQGNNEGITHNFEISTDVFASDDEELVNNKEYHFALVTYAAANPSDSTSANADRQYLEGRDPIKFTVVPHKVIAEKGGVVQQASFGDQPRLTRIEGAGNGGMRLDLTEKTEQEIVENGSVPNPTYKVNGGPVDLFVHDPLNVPQGNFMFQLNDTTVAGTQGEEVSNSTTWTLTRLGPDGNPQTKINANRPLIAENEQVVDQYGISVNLEKTFGPSLDTVVDSLGLQGAEITYEDEGARWLTGVEDDDRRDSRTIPDPEDWIRSGGQGNPRASDDHNTNLADASQGENFIDPQQVYESLLGGIVAPYGLTAISSGVPSSGLPTYGPAYPSALNRENGTIENLNSVDLVFTDDKSKWTQCVVIEMNPDGSLAEGDAEKFGLRDHGSWLDPNAIEDGEPQYVDKSEDKGRSWFPGYAINLETGKRLNIIFGEDSWLSGENGDDMLWNPTSNQINDAASGRDFDRYPLAGKHYIYVMGEETSNNLAQDPDAVSAVYDSGKTYQRVLSENSISGFSVDAMYGAGMWVMVPALREGFEYKSLEEGLIPTETKVSLRVDVPYETDSTSISSENGNVPMYSFNTNGLATRINEDMGKAALDNVRAVPNPYYAASGYEQSQLDNRVRITNLPQQCEISIYTLDGKLVRQFNKDQTEENHQTYLDWNLRNGERVPIGSGVYLVHVDAGRLGSTTVKWFGIRRPLDLDTF